MTLVFPYSSAETVQHLVAQLLPPGATGFTSGTRPTLAAVTYYLQLAAATVDMHLAQAGYYLPLADIEGETLPVSTSYFMDYLVGLGTAGLLGNTLRPAPAMGPGAPNSPGNLFQDQFNNWLDRIGSGRMGLRANYRIGSAAERYMQMPRGPMWSDGSSAFSDLADAVSFWESAFEEGARLLYQQQIAPSYRPPMDWK